MTSNRWWTAFAVVMLLSALSGCSNLATPDAQWVSPQSTGSPPPAESLGPPTITLTFAGDVHFAERTLALLSSPDTAFGPVAQTFAASDLAMVNLETAVTTRGTEERKTFHFRAPPSSYDAIKAAGIDVVSIANNHTLDYGRVGLDDTLSSARAAGVPAVGAGANAAEAYAPWITTVKGVKIAFLGFSQIQELASSWVAKDDRAGLALAYDSASTAKAVAAVRAARQQADLVVVYMHWGQEYKECPNANQKNLAKALSEAGAGIVVGTHSHVLQGDGYLGQTFVAYGMSNFLWWYNDAGSNDTGVIKITLTGPAISKTEFIPAYINRTTGQPIPSTGAEATRIATKYANLRPCTGLTQTPA